MNTQKNGLLLAGKIGAMGLVLGLVLAFGASQALAASDKGGYQGGAAAGGYTGPAPKVSTVEQAKSARDDTWVTLQGYIVESLGGEEYIFRDDTGTIKVEIDGKRWQGQTIGPNDLVEIHGEVDSDLLRVEIEVKRLIKL